MQCPANGWNWFVYSDLHPYNPTDGGGLTGLSVNASAPNTYVVPNDFKVLSVYNHEIKVEENTSVPEAENSAEDGANWAAEAVFNCVYDDDEQTLKANVTTEVFEPTFTEDGRIVHTARVTFNGQEYSDVRVVKTDDKLVLTYEKVEATAATYTSEGNTEYYIGADGKYYVKNGNDYIETTLEAVTIARLTPGAYLTLQNNLKVNIVFKKELFDETGYENSYVVFVVDGNEITVSEYTANDKYYIFTLNDINKDQLNSEVTVTLYATYNDTLVSSDSITSTILDYGTQGCDINGDGTVDIRDRVRLKKLLCEVPNPEESETIPDLDFNGALDALDLTYIFKMLLFA